MNQNQDIHWCARPLLNTIIFRVYVPELPTAYEARTIGSHMRP
jgi:hypothetical protein